MQDTKIVQYCSMLGKWWLSGSELPLCCVKESTFLIFPLKYVKCVGWLEVEGGVVERCVCGRVEGAPGKKQFKTTLV